MRIRFVPKSTSYPSNICNLVVIWKDDEDGSNSDVVCFGPHFPAYTIADLKACRQVVVRSWSMLRGAIGDIPSRRIRRERRQARETAACQPRIPLVSTSAITAAITAKVSLD